MHITLVLRSYDRSSLTKAVKLLCFLGHSLQTKTCQTWALSLHPLPTKVKKYTLLRSPHIDKKSREQIELKTYQKAIHIKNIQDKKTFLGFLHLVKLVHLDGVQCKCTFEAQTSL